MILYEVGKQFPVNNLADGNEKCLASFNEAFFDVCFYSKMDTSDTKMVKNEKLEYGLYNNANVPFFLINFPESEFALDVSLNIHKVKDESVEAWLNSDSNIINFYLINASSNELLAMRMISINNGVAEEIRDSLENQDTLYKDAAAVDYAINEISSNYSTAVMLRQAKMYKSVKL